ncbi:MAG TPA: glycosyltransferase family 2 protein [bacterium]|nr:glycosyltransferase family 2 protein [bacterium]
MRNCSILIPTYNGRDILEQCLPNIVDAATERRADDEIIILDNASGDGTAEFIAENYPQCRVVRLPENKAIFALNDGARVAEREHLFLLNNDMLLRPGCLEALLEPFDDPDAFAVTGKVFRRDGSLQATRRRPEFKRGRFWYVDTGEDGARGLTLHALGGQSVVSREKFLALGGIDPLFSPFYQEDLDLSWRALRRGWKIIFEPAAEMIHFGAITADRLFSRDEILSMIQKNLITFAWKNIHDPRMTASLIAWTGPQAARAALKGDFHYLKGLAGALARLPDILKARKQAAASILSDKDVFKLFEK